MPQTEKVISELEKLPIVVYFGSYQLRMTHDLRDEIVELLKEQKAVAVQYSAFGGMRYGACPRCNARIDNLVNPKACGYCGQVVKWE